MEGDDESVIIMSPESSSDEVDESEPSASEQLFRAVREDDLSKVKYLVEERHVDPDSCRDGEDKDTPLHCASYDGHLDIVRYLVEERNCNAQCRGNNGDIPLHRAAVGGRLDTVQYLISERGCDPMSRGWCGRTPHHCACEYGGFDLVKYLIEDVKVDSSCRDVIHVTPLHVAAHYGHLSAVKALVVDYMCDPGVRDKCGGTPADWANDEGHTHITNYLSSIEKTVSSECDYYYCWKCTLQSCVSKPSHLTSHQDCNQQLVPTQNHTSHTGRASL